MLYLCRHGETEWALAGKHTSTTDISLTEKGMLQAQELQENLKKIPLAKVYSSPRKRALQTCQGMDVVIDPLLVEWDYGSYEGLTTQEIQKKNSSWNLFRDGAPGGESPEEIGKRADQFLAKIGKEKGNIALFSHAHFLRVLAVRFLDLPVEYAKFFVLGVGSISVLGWERTQKAIIHWNQNFL